MRRTFHSSSPGQALSSTPLVLLVPPQSLITLPGEQPAPPRWALVSPDSILLCLGLLPTWPPQTPPSAPLLSPLPFSCLPLSPCLLRPHLSPCPFRSFVLDHLHLQNPQPLTSLDPSDEPQQGSWPVHSAVSRPCRRLGLHTGCPAHLSPLLSSDPRSPPPPFICRDGLFHRDSLCLSPFPHQTDPSHHPVFPFLQSESS